MDELGRKGVVKESLGGLGVVVALDDLDRKVGVGVYVPIGVAPPGRMGTLRERIQKSRGRVAGRDSGVRALDVALGPLVVGRALVAEWIVDGHGTPPSLGVAFRKSGGSSVPWVDDPWKC